MLAFKALIPVANQHCTLIPSHKTIAKWCRLLSTLWSLDTFLLSVMEICPSPGLYKHPKKGPSHYEIVSFFKPLKLLEVSTFGNLGWLHLLGRKSMSLYCLRRTSAVGKKEEAGAMTAISPS